VLYAFDAERGELRWARRVGVDTSVLPLRLPPDPITPELLVVLSSDRPAVSALVAETGALVWRHELEAPCTSQPLLIGRSLLVPTLAGRIDEIEITGGRLLGHYELGQRLSVGGAMQPGTARAFFPGDGFCVYVLDTTTRTCEAVLYANHPAGSLRGPPILVPGKATPAKEGKEVKGQSGSLLLCQSDGSAKTLLRAFNLPIEDPDQAPSDVEEIKGLSWFPPYHDADKLALATDAGLLSLWGIQQKGNRYDPLLFRMLKDGKDDYHVGGSPGRAQVVHADADGYWVLGGSLKRLRSVMRLQSGPDLTSAWPQPPSLGSPLHAAQRHQDESGRASLLLATLATDRPTCRLTAVDAATGNLDWQRQLGCVNIHSPAARDGRVLLRDPNGLFLLDSEQYSGEGVKPRQAIDDFLVREPLGPNDEVLLLVGSTEFVQLAWSRTAAPPKLRVRHIPPIGDSRTEEHELQALPAGTSAMGNGFALLPLANGVVARVSFGGTILAGPHWRGSGVDEQFPGHVVMVGADEFLMTDGRSGMARVSWPGKTHQQRAACELTHRIVSAPAVLPGTGGARPRLAVADASDTLSLLDAERLEVLRRWPLPGKITAGPFVQEGGIVCIVEHKRVVRIDPDRPGDRDSVWEYTMVGDIVGAPVLLDGMLIIADVSGAIVAFEPNTGRTLGGYTLRANVAPDAAPVPFGAGRLLLPLNDGTLVLLPLAKLR
jgi:outer membrane protein assembly factor BamB